MRRYNYNAETSELELDSKGYYVCADVIKCKLEDILFGSLLYTKSTIQDFIKELE